MALGDLLASVRAGVSVKAEPRPARDGERGILTLRALVAGRLDPAANKAVPDLSVARLGPSVRAGTILISRSNTEELVGSSVYVEHDHPQLYLPDLIWELDVRPDAGIDPRWLQAYLGSERARRSLRRLTAGTSGTMKKLSMGRLRTLRIPRIPRREQQAAVQVLESFDAQSQSIARLLRAKRRLKRGLLQQLLTGELRFSALAKKAWQPRQLGALFDERLETNHGELPLLAVTGTRGVVPRDTLKRRDSSNPNKARYKRVRSGDLVYNTMRMWQGVSGLSALDGIVSPAYTVLIPRDGISGRFASHLFKLPSLVHLFWRQSYGLVDDTLALRFPDFARIAVAVPGIEEQERMADLLDAVDREIELLERQAALLRLQRRDVLERLLKADDEDR